jgi:hypothetical protein
VNGYSSPRPIRDSDDVVTFDSGEADLDSYLRNRALANHAEGGASHCLVTCRDQRLVGFYALAAAVERRSAPGRIRREPLPVILLSRLAIDAQNKAKAWARICCAMPSRVASWPDLIGVRVILVHALHNQARAFYTHFGFESSPSDPLHLLLLIKDARALLDQ